MLTVGSLFSGIGGLELGLEWTGGFVTKWQVECDDYCNRVLERRWPDVRRYRDVREVGRHNLEPVDLICGGFPCQDVSLAGKRAGLDGKRSTLWGEFARIIGEIRPGWVLAENVPGLLSSDDGRFFGNILRDLATCGYDAEWDCIPAAAVGAPHRRDRIFIVAYAKSTRARMDKRSLWRLPSKTNMAVDWGERPCGSRLCRVADGVSRRVDRLRCLGNAVVPAVAEWVGRRIVDAESAYQNQTDLS